jgi:hypothetical protein
MAGVLDRRIKCVACQNPSMLDGWTAFEQMRGRLGMAMVRQVAAQDWEQRFTTGQGISVPGLGADDKKVAEYAAQAVELYPTFRNELALESMDHLLVWNPVNFIHRLAPSPLLMITGAEDSIHDIGEVLSAFERAREPKRIEILPYDEFGLSIEPGLGESMRFSVEWFDIYLRKAKPFQPSPSAQEMKERGLRPEFRRS